MRPSRMQDGYLLAKPDPERDFLIRSARVLFYAGTFAVSLLVFRVGGGVTIGDLLLMGSAAILSLGPRESAGVTVSKRAVTALGLLIFGGALASAISPAPVESMLIALRVIYVAVVLPWQARRLLNTRRRLSLGFTALALGAAVCGIAAILPGRIVAGAGRYPGLAMNVSDAGGINCLAVVAGVAGLGKGTSKKTKLLSFGLIAGGMIGLVLSGSVSGMAAAGVGVLVILLLRGIGVFRLVLVAAVGFFGFTFASGVIDSTKNALTPIERIQQTLGLINTSDATLNTTASRMATYQAGWDAFIQHPVTGVGLDTGSSIVDPFMGLAVHNFFLAAFYQGGVLFGLAMVTVVLGVILGSLRWVSRDGLAVRAFATMAAAFVFAMTAPSFYNRYFWVPLALLVAYAALRRAEHAAESQTDARMSMTALAMRRA